MIDAPIDPFSETTAPGVLRVSDVMGPVITVARHATLREAAQLILQKRVLVVDEQSNAVDIVTERQLACDDRHLLLAFPPRAGGPRPLRV